MRGTSFIAPILSARAANGERPFLPTALVDFSPSRLSGARAKMGGGHNSTGRTNAMKTATARNSHGLKERQRSPLATPTDLSPEATRDVAGAMNAILADVFALYLKTKNFHWHLSGPHFRDYHLMLDEQAEQLFAMTDPAAERVRKIGGTTLRSIGHVSRLQRVTDNDAEYVEPEDMLAELCEDNKVLAGRLREAHGVCDDHRDLATASLIEVWIDETERRTWFLFEASRREMTGGH
jgi:starvation-inducible DNA-binding protein